MGCMEGIPKVEFQILRNIRSSLFFQENQDINTAIKMGGKIPMFFHTLVKDNQEICSLLEAI